MDTPELKEIARISRLADGIGADNPNSMLKQDYENLVTPAVVQALAEEVLKFLELEEFRAIRGRDDYGGW